MLQDVHDASDRTAAIILAAWVEQGLEQAIIGRFARNDNDTIKRMQDHGSLNSFYAKNYLGYALGLYNQNTLRNLESIRKIRNAFAHSAIQIDFSIEEITGEVYKINYQEDPELAKQLPEVLSKHRAKYTLFCFWFVVIISLKKIGAKLETMGAVLDALAPQIESVSANRQHIEAIKRASKTLKNIES